MSKGKINLAAVARTNDISYQRLLKKVKAGIPLSTAIDECLIAREASISSGSRPHRSSRGQGPITWRGTTYATFAAACQEIGISLSTAYAQRSRLVANERLSIEQASIRVLDRAADNMPRRHKRTPVIINGVQYDSQALAAQVLGISMGTIAARRVRNHVSFSEAVNQILADRSGINLSYNARCTDTPYWAQLSAALATSIPGADPAPDFVFFASSIASATISMHITLLSPNYAYIISYFREKSFLIAGNMKNTGIVANYKLTQIKSLE